MRISYPLRRYARLGLCWAGILLTLNSINVGPACQQSPTPTSAIPAGRPVEIALQVPAGFRISLYAQGLGEARMIAFDAQGIPYVTIMNRKARVMEAKS